MFRKTIGQHRILQTLIRASRSVKPCHKQIQGDTTNNKEINQRTLNTPTTVIRDNQKQEQTYNNTTNRITTSHQLIPDNQQRWENCTMPYSVYMWCKVTPYSCSSKSLSLLLVLSSFNLKFPTRLRIFEYYSCNYADASSSRLCHAL